MSREDTLAAWRREAAYASGCVSTDPIYRVFERVIARYDLRGSLLDFGAGSGRFTRRLAALSRFSAITAADLLPAPPDLAGVRWHAQDLNEPLRDLPDAAFDVIVAVEVVEHLENPRALAREWFRLLRPGGMLIASTPNNESLRAIASLARKGHFALFNDESYPAHLTALLRKDLQRVLGEAGFTFLEFVYSDEGLIPTQRRLTWQAVSARLLKGLRFSDNLVAVARRPT